MLKARPLVTKAEPNEVSIVPYYRAFLFRFYFCVEASKSPHGVLLGAAQLRSIPSTDALLVPSRAR
jgi:hypothetical protein